MLIKHKGEGIRQSKLNVDDALSSKPEPWQFPTFSNAANMGFELFWEYGNTYVDEFGESESDRHKKLSPDFFSLTLDLKIKTPKNQNILIIPHYKLYINENLNDNFPVVSMQTIETDWYPNNIEIIFTINPAGTFFEKGSPIAQGFCIPRREHTIKEMSGDEIKHNKRACKFIEENKNEYITRTEKFESFDGKDNLYEVLSSLALRNKLPKELQEEAPKLGSRLKRPIKR